SKAMLSLPADVLARGVWTASAGNMAQGVAWQARRMGVPCTVVAPDRAPLVKLAAIERLGARVMRLPFEEWFQILATRTCEGLEGPFIHPVSDAAVVAGNGTIGVEILEQLPDAAAIVVPWGGGGLSCGIATAVRALAPAPGVPIYACEVDVAAPLAASLAAGGPTPVPYRASFVDGMGAPFVLAEMWPLARRLLAGSLVTTLDEI